MRKIIPYLIMILLQFGYGGMTIIGKFALNEGTSTYTLVVYRHALAAVILTPFALIFERNTGRRLTLPIFLKITSLALLEPVIDQNLFFTGMKYTSASFTGTLSNILPAMTFLFAWIFRLERVDLRERGSIAKVLGTVVSVSGAMVMTLYRGPLLIRESGEGQHHHTASVSPAKNLVKGSLFLIVACCSGSGYVILQAVTLREYPLALKVSTLVCVMGAALGAPVALVMERNNMAAWSLKWDVKLLAIVYAAVVCSGIAYCMQGYIMKLRGPVFVTAFGPLYMIIVAAGGLIILGEDLTLGRVIGAVFIIFGLYMVVWGKNRDERQPPLGQEAGQEGQGVVLEMINNMDVYD